MTTVMMVVVIIMYCNNNFRGKYWTASWPKIVRITRVKITEAALCVLSRCVERRLALILYTVLLFKYSDTSANEDNLFRNHIR